MTNLLIENHEKYFVRKISVYNRLHFQQTEVVGNDNETFYLILQNASLQILTE